MRRIMQSVLALLKERRVSLDEAWRVLSIKCSLLKSSVRSYMALHARVLMISNRDKQNRHQHDLPLFRLLKEWPK
jgi:hypothetical protein